MSINGLLIDNEYCTGCHSCEVACKNEHGLELGQWGIKVMEMGPWKLTNSKKWEHRFIVAPTISCDMCESYMAAGATEPTCVHHCLAKAIEFGPVEELAKKMEAKGKKCSIFLP